MAISTRALPLFAVVTFLLGIPYLLIAVALTGFDAAFVAWARVTLAAIVLIAVIKTWATGSLAAAPYAGCFSVVQLSVPMLLSAAEGCRTDRSYRHGRAAGRVGRVAILLGVKFGGGLTGAGLVLGAAAAYALATLVIPRLTVDVPAMHLVAVGLVISALTLLPLVLRAPPDRMPSCSQPWL